MSFSTRLVLKDGTILKNCECGYYDKTLGCFLKGISFGEAFQYFSDPSKFETVVFDMIEERFIERIQYSGLEDITSVVKREFTVEVYLTGSDVHIEKIRIPADKDGDESNGSVYNQNQNQS